ncbi:DUF3618 domain-containing protein [Phycicoccus sp. BSK3Z-2]|uniref:DUF3618 domain-containing protein n=1 Tax=Phycicoccus avicenniae TaxID=2828860 RepID=A0A941I069_9MICO|nr:DUF3618 domain-containing protein [Phycicoccus avicenniae]MBR7743752.1 DUF3618 domain-containing protein [Phycicoccus avicenniae]
MSDTPQDPHAEAAADAAGPDARTDTERIEAHIEETRQDLAETVDALGAKLDVRSRARDRWRETVGVADDGHTRPSATIRAALAGVVAVAAATAAVLVWRRGR